MRSRTRTAFSQMGLLWPHRSFELGGRNNTGPGLGAALDVANFNAFVDVVLEEAPQESGLVETFTEKDKKRREPSGSLYRFKGSGGDPVLCSHARVFVRGGRHPHTRRAA